MVVIELEAYIDQTNEETRERYIISFHKWIKTLLRLFKKAKQNPQLKQYVVEETPMTSLLTLADQRPAEKNNLVFELKHRVDQLTAQSRNFESEKCQLSDSNANLQKNISHLIETNNQLEEANQRLATQTQTLEQSLEGFKSENQSLKKTVLSLDLEKNKILNDLKNCLSLKSNLENMLQFTAMSPVAPTEAQILQTQEQMFIQNEQEGSDPENVISSDEIRSPSPELSAPIDITDWKQEFQRLKQNTTAELSDKDQEIERLNETIQEWRDKNTQLSRTLTDTAKTNQWLENQLQETSTETAKTVQIIQQQEEEISRLEDQLRATRKFKAEVDIENEKCINLLGSQTETIRLLETRADKLQNDGFRLGDENLALRNELKNCHSNLEKCQSELRQCQLDLSEQKHRNDELESRLMSCIPQAENLQKFVDDLKDQMRQKDDQIDRLSSQMDLLLNEQEDILSSKNMLIRDFHSKLKERVEHVEHLENQLAEAETFMQEKENDYADLKRQLNRVSAETDSLKQFLTAQMKIPHETDLPTSLERLRDVISEKDIELDALHAQLKVQERLVQDLSQCAVESRRLEGENARLQSKLADCELRLAQCIEESKTLSEMLEAKNQIIDQLNVSRDMDKTELSTELTSCNETLDKGRKILRSCNSKFKTYEKLYRKKIEKITQEKIRLIHQLHKTRSKNTEMEVEKRDLKILVDNLQEEIITRESVVQDLRHRLDSVYQSELEHIQLEHQPPADPQSADPPTTAEDTVKTHLIFFKYYSTYVLKLSQELQENKSVSFETAQKVVDLYFDFRGNRLNLFKIVLPDIEASRPATEDDEIRITGESSLRELEVILHDTIQMQTAQNMTLTKEISELKQQLNQHQVMTELLTRLYGAGEDLVKRLRDSLQLLGDQGLHRVTDFVLREMESVSNLPEFREAFKTMKTFFDKPIVTADDVSNLFSTINKFGGRDFFQTFQALSKYDHYTRLLSNPNLKLTLDLVHDIYSNVSEIHAFNVSEIHASNISDIHVSEIKHDIQTIKEKYIQSQYQKMLEVLTSSNRLVTLQDLVEGYVNRHLTADAIPSAEQQRISDQLTGELKECQSLLEKQKEETDRQTQIASSYKAKLKRKSIELTKLQDNLSDCQNEKSTYLAEQQEAINVREHQMVELQKKIETLLLVNAKLTKAATDSEETIVLRDHYIENTKKEIADLRAELEKAEQELSRTRQECQVLLEHSEDGFHVSNLETKLRNLERDYSEMKDNYSSEKQRHKLKISQYNVLSEQYLDCKKKLEEMERPEEGKNLDREFSEMAGKKKLEETHRQSSEMALDQANRQLLDLKAAHEECLRQYEECLAYISVKFNVKSGSDRGEPFTMLEALQRVAETRQEEADRLRGEADRLRTAHAAEIDDLEGKIQSLQLEKDELSSELRQQTAAARESEEPCQGGTLQEVLKRLKWKHAALETKCKVKRLQERKTTQKLMKEKYDLCRRVGRLSDQLSNLRDCHQQLTHFKGRLGDLGLENASLQSRLEKEGQQLAHLKGRLEVVEREKATLQRKLEEKLQRKLEDPVDSAQAVSSAYSVFFRRMDKFMSILLTGEEALKDMIKFYTDFRGNRWIVEEREEEPDEVQLAIVSQLKARVDELDSVRVKHDVLVKELSFLFPYDTESLLDRIRETAALVGGDGLYAVLSLVENSRNVSDMRVIFSKLKEFFKISLYDILANRLKETLAVLGRFGGPTFLNNLSIYSKDETVVSALATSEPWQFRQVVRLAGHILSSTPPFETFEELEEKYIETISIPVVGRRLTESRKRTFEETVPLSELISFYVKMASKKARSDQDAEIDDGMENEDEDSDETVEYDSE